jgi:[acyl-carrier-protein] S-malonyltransferase
MGKSLYEGSAAAREVFDLYEQIRPGLKELCFSGSAEELAQTVNTQPALFACEMAAAKAAEEAGLTCEAAAGFSLGEVTAYTFAGGVSLEEGFQLVIKRAELMHADAQKAASGMAAVLKLSAEQVENVCAGFSHAYPVNYNAPGQVSVAVAADEMDAFKAAVKDAGGKALPLKVSGGFHSPFMAQAAEKFADVLSSFPLDSPKIPLYSNYTAGPYDMGAPDTADAGASSALTLLSRQISAPVRWEALVRNMAAAGVDTFVEVGPGTVLTGLVKKILPDAVTVNVAEFSDVEGRRG